MRRALRLARRGQGFVEPNPMVGCVLVKNDRIIAEGYHHYFGGPHAEVDALRREIEVFRRELRALPGTHGFGSMAAFIKELRRAERAAGGARRAGRRKRAKITPETKQKVKALVAAGKTGPAQRDGPRAHSAYSLNPVIPQSLSPCQRSTHLRQSPPQSANRRQSRTPPPRPPIPVLLWKL